ncbi:hypothetical protein [Treponema sp.]|uniref:hypothetical protein n=1 Tax=Treponema sp. TaxID=166 RepID=UPI0025EC9F1A|nr:hypothetical protein [Treponema sp.]MBR4320891.1 hypothetical protein [Treponema sp.]
MIKVSYPDEFVNKFYDIFNFSADQEKKWKNFCKRYKFLSNISNLKDLILASPETLSYIFINLKNGFFIKSKTRILKSIKRNLSFISYDKYASEIITYFLINKDVLNISTCSYCNMAYVNIFKREIDDLIKIMNENRISNYFKILNITDTNGNKQKKITDYLKTKKFDSLSEIYNVFCKTDYDNIIHYFIKQQFDIDHFLPKNECSLISLSLYNLIPSCLICNERLKHEKYVLQNEKGINPKRLECLFPTSQNYKYNEDLCFVVKGVSEGAISYTSQIDNAKIELELRNGENNDYMNEAKLFMINDRYQFHIIEPLNHIDKLKKYTKSYFRMLFSNINESNFRESEIDQLYEAVFDNELRNKHGRVFEKLYADINGQYAPNEL